jgi:transcriptional regulator with XRE-family HTH domain
MVDSVAKVMGTGARALRIDAGVTLEEMAHVARRYGLPWTSGRVGDFEAGRTAPTVPTLIAATAALGDVIGRRVSLADLVTGRGQVQINNELRVNKSALRGALAGDTVHAPPIRVSPFAAHILKKAENTAVWPARLLAAEPDLRNAVLQEFSESDARMCKSIGVAHIIGAAAMATLWGRTFSAERDHRAGPDANAQHRGQISRRLKADLQEIIENGDDQ